MELIETLINNGLFPCAMCLLLWFQMIKSNETHDKEMTNVLKSLDNNTKAIELLTQRLSDKEVVAHDRD